MPAQAPQPSPETTVQPVFEGLMVTADGAGLLSETPLHRMAGFLSSESGKGYLFDVMASNTAFGDQHRVIVMTVEDRDGTPTLTTPLEEFRWNIPASQGDRTADFEVHHVSHDPELGYIGPEQALGRLAGLLTAQTGEPTELVFAED